MAVISITTTQNIELEYELAGIGERIVATIIDIVIILGYFIIINVFGSLTYENTLFWILFGLPVTFYSLISELVLNGQTVGKKVMGIKVISLNGNHASFSQYIIRWMFRLADLWFSFFLVGTISIATTEKHQRLGDLVAGTTLIRIKPRNTIEQTLYVPTAQTNYNVTYPEVINLRDTDMQLIKEVIINVRKSGNNMLAWQTTEKLEKLLHIKNQYDDPLNFLYVILSDYNHLAAQEK